MFNVLCQDLSNDITFLTRLAQYIWSLTYVRLNWPFEYVSLLLREVFMEWYTQSYFISPSLPHPHTTRADWGKVYATYINLIPYIFEAGSVNMEQPNLPKVTSFQQPRIFGAWSILDINDDLSVNLVGSHMYIPLQDLSRTSHSLQTS